MTTSEMEAGREMDALMAEKVFNKPPSYYNCPHFDENGRILSFCSCPSLPPYSTDIVAAWQVVEKMDHLDCAIEYSVKNDEVSEQFGRWFVLFGEELEKGAFADTAPLAICRAARMAVE
jgi:hypothetical protein